MFFKEPLTEYLFVEPNMVLLWHRCEEPFEAPLLLRVHPLAISHLMADDTPCTGCERIMSRQKQTEPILITDVAYSIQMCFQFVT